MSQQPDGSWLDITEMPRRQLEEEYMSQLHFLIGAIRAAGGRLTIPHDCLTDAPPKRFRLYMELDTQGQSYTLHAREEP